MGPFRPIRRYLGFCLEALGKTDSHSHDDEQYANVFQMENGYHIYDFKGEALREEPLEKFKQFSWRPRPATMLTKEEQKAVRKNLREYSRVFEQEDADRGASADLAVVEARRTMLQEWHNWREEVEADTLEEREVLGLPKDPHAPLLEAYTKSLEGTTSEADRVIEEIVEEVLEESEEVLG